MVMKVKIPPGKIAGSGVIRDKHGNVKTDKPKQEKLSGDSHADKRRS